MRAGSGIGSGKYTSADKIQVGTVSSNTDVPSHLATEDSYPSQLSPPLVKAIVVDASSN